MKNKTCCFIGDNPIRKTDIKNVMIKLDKQVKRLIDHDITNFVSCCESGFETVATLFLITLKQQGLPVNLTLVLSNISQLNVSDEKQKKINTYILQESDKFVFVTNEKRDLNKINQSAFCITYSRDVDCDTSKNIKYAKENNINIIRL